MKNFKNGGSLAVAVFALFALLLCAVPQSRADAFADANRAFAQGRYAESASGYERVLKEDGYSAAVLFDLANADWRLGKTGDAILNYRRAQWLAPRDPDIAANLLFAEKRAGVSEPGDSWAGNVSNLLSPNAWSWIGCGALTLLCAGVLGAQFRADRQTSFGLLSALSAVVLIVALGAIAVRSQEVDLAIISAKAAPALISPFGGAKTVCEFSAGQTVNVEKAYGGFRLVRDFAGHSGWVNQAELGMIAADS